MQSRGRGLCSDDDVKASHRQGSCDRRQPAGGARPPRHPTSRRRRLNQGRDQAARTELRNLPTSSLRRFESVESDCAADSTCDDAEPVSLAPRCTSVMLEETSWVPCAACCTLREISWVAAPCSSTAAAIVEEISDSFSIVPEISLMALTESWVAAWMPLICVP